MTYARKLSPLERLHAAVGASSHTLESPRVSVHVVEGEGELDPARWRAAVRAAGAANPGTRVVLRGHLWRARWQEDPASGPRVRVVEGSTWGGQSSVGAEVLDGPMSLRDGPVCEVVLLPGCPARVAFRDLHAAMDGRGLLHFAADVFRCLRGEAPVGSDSRLTDFELMSSVKGGEAPFVARHWQEPTGEAVGSARGDVWRRIDLPGKHSHLLARVALATARHAWQHHGAGPVRFGVPVDLRPLASGVRSTANLTGMACLDVSRGATIESLESALRSQIARGDHATVPDAVSAVSMVPLDRLDQLTGRTARNYREPRPTMHSGAISNMGRVALAELSGGGFHAQKVFTTPQPGSFFITLMGCEAGASLTVNTPRIFATGGRLDALCDAIADEFVGVGASAPGVASAAEVETPQSYSRADFGDDFVWGVATSAYQIEGAVAEGGRRPSVWDEFERPRRYFPTVLPRVRNLDSAAVACDHYNRVEEDLDLIADLGVNAYRLSIAWPRVLPLGDGPVNEAGLRFYDRLIDGALARGLTPYVTLYHWDLPAALEKRGGWTNRAVVSWFRRFADVCVRAFGDRVKNWVVINEALSFTLLGHLFGVAAPGRHLMRNFLPAVHHSQLAQAAGARAIKEVDPAARVGTAVAMTRPHPFSDRVKDVQAAARLQAFQRIYLDPVLGRGYPTAELPVLHKLERYVQPGDMDDCAVDLDFIGVNHYFRFIVRHNPLVPLFQLSPAGPAPSSVVTALDWEVHAPSLFDLLCELGADPDMPELVVTENGAAFEDRVDADGRVCDYRRRDYLRDYVGQVLRARRAGVRVGGYFAWSAFDNFEWQSGFAHRFGLYHVDYATQTRTLKDSGRWYRDLLRGAAQAGASEAVRRTA